MLIRFHCACGKALEVDGGLAGKKARCPFCQRVADVPDETVEDEGTTALSAAETASARRRVPWLALIATAVVAFAAGGATVWLVLFKQASLTQATALYKKGSEGSGSLVVASAQTPTSPPPATGPESARTETPQSLPLEVVKPATESEKKPSEPAVTIPPTIDIPATEPKGTTEPKPETPSALPAGPLNADVSEKIQGVVLAQLQKMVEGPSTLPKPIHEGVALEATLDDQTYQATVYKGFNIYTDPKGNILPKMLKFYIRTSNAWKVSEETIIPAGTHIHYEYALGKCEVVDVTTLPVEEPKKKPGVLPQSPFPGP